MSDPIDPLSPDAPILAWMSLATNPNLPVMAKERPEEFRALVAKLRATASNPSALTQKLNEEAPARKPRDPGVKEQRKADLRASLLALDD